MGAMTTKRRHNDGISTDRLPSGNYRYRVRDPNAGRYESASFERTDEDKDRDEPGTAAGDRWAEAQLARYRLGFSTAEPALLPNVANAYLAQLGSERPSNRPMHEKHVREVTRTLTSLTTFRPSLDLNKFNDARGALREWLLQLKAVHKTDKGKVLRHKLDLSGTTKARYLIHAKAMIRWALGEGIIARDPVANLKGPSPDRTIPPVFTLTQARTFFKKPRPTESAWLWVAVMILGGLRRSEALALRWEDIMWRQALIKVTKGKGSAARLVPLQGDLRAILEPLGGPDAKHPRIGRIITGRDFRTGNDKHEWTLFRRVLTSCKIDPDLGIDAITGRMARLHPHSCRHTFGGMMLASGYDSMLLRHAMGHRQADTTGDYSKSATAYRAEITAEGWEPGELRLLSRAAKKAMEAK
jgi:integrase